MSRLPYAAKQLIDEIAEHTGTAIWAPVAEADGLDVWRTVGFDVKTSKWLRPALEVCQDERIESMNETGKLEVTFVADQRADTVAPFGVEAAHRVLTGKD